MSVFTVFKTEVAADGEIRPWTQCFLGIIKDGSRSNIVKTWPSNVNCGNINAIAKGPLMRDQHKGAIIANLLFF